MDARELRPLRQIDGEAVAMITASNAYRALAVTTVTSSAAGTTSTHGSAKWMAKPAWRSQRSTHSCGGGSLLGEDVGVDLPARVVVEIAVAMEEPGKHAHFDLLTCGRCGRRENRSTSLAPASSATAALSNADALAPSTPILPSLKRAKSMSSAEWKTRLPPALRCAGQRRERRQRGARPSRRARRPARPCARRRSRARRSAQFDAHEILGPDRFARLDAVLDRHRDRVAHPQQVGQPIGGAILWSRSQPSAPCFASYQARKVSAGKPRSGPVRCLGERRMSMRAKVSHGPSRPRGARSTQRRLRTPSRAARRPPSARTCRRRRPARRAPACRRGLRPAAPSSPPESAGARNRVARPRRGHRDLEVTRTAGSGGVGRNHRTLTSAATWLVIWPEP